MIATFDIGNSNIKVGIYDGDELLQYARFKTDTRKTSDEYGLLLINVFNYSNIDKEKITGAIVSSVVPSINYTIEHMLRTFLDVKPIIIGPGVKTGMDIFYENSWQVGADRIVTSVAAKEMYGCPVIVVDFGTATTFNAVDKNGNFIGGAIMPGIKPSTDALVESAARLPKIEFVDPGVAIGKSTVENMQSGIINGFSGAVDNIVNNMKKEIEGDVTVVATGGMSTLIGPASKTINKIDARLALKGLKILYQKNSK
ncbi:MAG: type III pantothenate kinase [Eubacteriales bacterium]